MLQIITTRNTKITTHLVLLIKKFLYHKSIVYQEDKKMNQKILILGVLLFMFNCAGTRPNNLGVNGGKLLACPATPNCVSSQADKNDTVHFIEPYKYTKDLATAFKELSTVIENQKRTKIISYTDNYLNVEFTSLLMRYVDDVEFYFDDASKTVHIRSASRLGKGDLGVNRKRMELIRKELNW